MSSLKRRREWSPRPMKTSYSGVAVPTNGKVIGYEGGKFQVPDQPVIPYHRRGWHRA